MIKMNEQDFHDVIFQMELMVIESFLWPESLIVDPEILLKLFPTVRVTHYILPSTNEKIPVVPGRKGQLKIKPTKLLNK